MVLTELGRKVWAGDVGEQMKKKIPNGRFGYPEEIAACALFLASGAVKYSATAPATKESRSLARFHHSYSNHINRRLQDIGVVATITRRLGADDEIGGNVFMEMML